MRWMSPVPWECLLHLGQEKDTGLSKESASKCYHRLCVQLLSAKSFHPHSVMLLCHELIKMYLHQSQDKTNISLTCTPISSNQKGCKPPVTSPCHPNLSSYRRSLQSPKATSRWCWQIPCVGCKGCQGPFEKSAWFHVES